MTVPNLVAKAQQALSRHQQHPVLVELDNTNNDDISFIHFYLYLPVLVVGRQDGPRA